MADLQAEDLEELEIMNAEVAADEDAGDDDYKPGSSSSAAPAYRGGRRGPHPDLPKEIVELRRRRTIKLQQLTREANEERRIHGDAQVAKRIEFFTKGAEVFTQYTLEQARLEAAHEAHEKEGAAGGAGAGAGKGRKKAAAGAGAGARAAHRLTEQEEDEVSD
jgi:hypothetical protein